MYDTLHFFTPSRLSLDSVNELNLNAKSAKEGIWESGNLENLRIITKPSGTTIKGSIAKFAIGNNVDNLSFSDVKPAIELLSDLINNDVSQWQVTRLDTAATLKMENTPEKYINSLLSVDNGTRYTYPNQTTYFQMAQDLLLFYDKKKELRKTKKSLYNDVKDSNLLRYEVQINKPLQAFNRPIIGKDLFDRDFQMQVLNRWYDNYVTIRKSTKKIINPEKMENLTPTAAIEMLLAKMLNSNPAQATAAINELANLLSDKQKKYRFKEKINELEKILIEVPTMDLVYELNTKILEVKNSA